jgi:dTDP-4-amino-4,6-dideoxygalactose transaminase
VNGGPPRRVIFGRPAFDEETIQDVAATLRSGWVGAGPRVEQFEDEFCRLVGSRFAVAVTSCTVGIEVALRACGLQPGEEVITSAVTFVATANAILHAGGVPVLVDVNPTTRNMDPIAVEKAITPRTRVIMPVHLAGLPCDIEELQSIARSHGLLLVDDAAHAVGAAVGGRPIGSLSDMTVFSFGPPKNVSTGEGGMVTTQSEQLAATARTFCRQGQPAGAWARLAGGNLGTELAVTAGHNYRMTDIAATLGLGGLRRFEADTRRRAEIWSRYEEAFAGLPLLTPPPAPPGTTHARQLYSPLVDVERLGQSREWVRARLHEHGIGSGVHYVPVHQHPYFADLLDLAPGDLPAAEHVGERTFSLPLSAHLDDDDVEAVVAAVVDVFSGP